MPQLTDANRRYSKKCSVFTGQRSIGLCQLGTVRCSYQEHNEATDDAEDPGMCRHQSTASQPHQANTPAITLATDKVSTLR